MTVIRVDPPALKQSAQDIQGLTERTNQVGHDLLRAANSAPSADNFQARVQSISAEAMSRSSSLGGRFLDLGGILVRKAYAFEAADQASISGIRSAGSTSPIKDEPSLWEKIKDWLKLPKDQSELWLRLGLIGGGIFSPLPIVLVAPWIWKNLPNWLGKTFPTQPKIDTSKVPPAKVDNSEALKPPVTVKPSKPWDSYTISGGKWKTYGDDTLHNGIDIVPGNFDRKKYDQGTNYPIHPIGPGTVKWIKTDIETDKDGKPVFENGKVKTKWYGNHVLIEHTLENGDKVYSHYAHLKETPELKEGEKVDTSTVIGNMGSTGNSSGPHLHLDVRKSPNLTESFWGKKPYDLSDPNKPDSKKWGDIVEDNYDNPEVYMQDTSEVHFKAN